MHDIFLSYAKEDKDNARTIALALEKEGFVVWWDVEIPTGQTWDKVIEKAITDTKCVVVLWSNHSVDSEWVNTEAAEGKNRNILIPIRIEDIEIPLAFKRRQTADLIDWNNSNTDPAFKRILVDIRRIIPENKPSTNPVDVFEEEKKEEEVVPVRQKTKNRGYIKFILIGAAIIIASFSWWKLQSDQKMATKLQSDTERLDSINEINNKKIQAAKLDSIERRQKIGLGKKFEGGIIFYIDDTGENGLIMAQGDQTSGNIKWFSGPIEKAGAYDNGIFEGKKNTEKIVSKFGEGDYPAKICHDLLLEGFDDWYLPSQKELDLLYEYDGHESFKHSYYWSSTEIPTAEVYYRSFFNGKSYDKIESNVGKVRAIRSF